MTPHEIETKLHELLALEAETEIVEFAKVRFYLNSPKF